MNKRLRQFERESGLEIYGLGQDRVKWKSVVEKFADLIVRECISMADKEAGRYSDLDQEYCSMAMDNYRELVRQHFGVES